MQAVEKAGRWLSRSQQSWSEKALYALVICIVGTVAMCILDGIFRGPLAYGGRGLPAMPIIAMWTAWIGDFRYFFEEGMFSSSVIFIGAKFLETRTVFSFGFDRVDAARLTMSGPDEENIVWIGRRFANPHEAEAVAAVLQGRLKESSG